MQNTPSPSPSENKDAAEQLTNLGETALTEIGRTVANYGLLVWQIREFVTFVAKHSNHYSVSISSKEAIRVFPSILEMIRPAFTSEERYKLETALIQSMTSREFLSRLSYSFWGKKSGKQDGVEYFVRYECRKYKGHGSRIDCQFFSIADIRDFAIEAVEARQSVADIHSIFESKITEDSGYLKKLLDSHL